MASVATQQIQEILALQKNAVKPSAAICSLIASLKDLCEIGSPTIEWRRQAPSPSVGGRTLFRGQPSPQAFTRTGSAFSLGSAGSESPGTPSTPMASTPKRGSTVTRYQSQFKNSSQPVEDKILNNIILSKLNKFCTSTYTDIREFLFQILGSGEADVSDLARQFMLLVFKKAAMEELYCSLYAKLLSETSQRYAIILEEMHKLQENYLSIFDDVQEKEEGEEYDKFVEKNIEKRYRLGYSQFIAELSKLEIINLACLESTFKRIFDCIKKNAVQPNKQPLIEEYIDCLLRMSHVFKRGASTFIISARRSLITLCRADIDIILSKPAEYISVSPKARFILMDVKDNLIG